MDQQDYVKLFTAMRRIRWLYRIRHKELEGQPQGGWSGWPNGIRGFYVDYEQLGSQQRKRVFASAMDDILEVVWNMDNGAMKLALVETLAGVWRVNTSYVSRHRVRYGMDFDQSQPSWPRVSGQINNILSRGIKIDTDLASHHINGILDGKVKDYAQKILIMKLTL